MKKWICLTVAILLCFYPLSSFASAKNENAWYFVSRNKNDRPTLPTVQNPSAKGIGSDEKVLYLTFDAGYENGNVKKITDILKENNVTGAFFVLKHFVEKNPALCLEIKENGNLVCNHTANHPDITSLSKEELKKEISDMERIYKEATGKEMDRFFRPPQGVWSEEALKTVEEMGYGTVFWSLAWADWDNNNQKSPEEALSKLYPRVHNGAVILLHPTSETNAKILDEFIKTMKEKGYRFGSIEEIFQ